MVTNSMIFKQVIWVNIGLFDNSYKVIWDCVNGMEGECQSKVVSVNRAAGCGDAQQVK